MISNEEIIKFLKEKIQSSKAFDKRMRDRDHHSYDPHPGQFCQGEVAAYLNVLRFLEEK